MRGHAEQLIVLAVEGLLCSAHDDCTERAERAIDALAATRGGPWARAVDTTVFALHLDMLRDKCWPEGWQPADVARCAVRQLGMPGRRVMADLMAAQLRAYAPTSIDDRWYDQLAELDAKVWWPTDADYVSSLMDARHLGRGEAVGLLVRLVGEPLRSVFKADAMRALLSGHGFEVHRDEALQAIGAGLSPAVARATRMFKHLRIVTADRAR